MPTKQRLHTPFSAETSGATDNTDHNGAYDFSSDDTEDRKSNGSEDIPPGTCTDIHHDTSAIQYLKTNSHAAHLLPQTSRAAMKMEIKRNQKRASNYNRDKSTKPPYRHPTGGVTLVMPEQRNRSTATAARKKATTHKDRSAVQGTPEPVNTLPGVNFTGKPSNTPEVKVKKNQQTQLPPWSSRKQAQHHHR